MNDTKEQFAHAKVLWDFSRLNHALAKGEIMLVLGNDDPRSAKHAADLFLEGWAPLVIISGKEGTGTKGKYDRTEAEVFCDIMTSHGVPREKIILELEATNTGENLKFSQRLLKSMGIVPKTLIIVTKSLMEMRVALTFPCQWLGSETCQMVVTSPHLSLIEYPSPDVGTFEDVVQTLMGNFEKLTEYATLGYQAPVHIPKTVKNAYHAITVKANIES